MPLPDPVVLSLVQALSTVESRLQELAEIHKKAFLKTLSARYGPEEAGQGWLDEEPYLRFLITTYAGQFYGTMTRVVKILRKPPKRTVRGKKTVGYAFPVTRGHFLVTKFDTRHPLPLQVDERIAVELGRLDHRFLTALSMYRQRAVGCENYIWRSQDDTRVRARHADYDDNVFAYSRPPDDGHPGQAYGCRCTAEPVWPEELSDSKIPTPSQQAIENAHVTGFLLFLAALSVLTGVAETVVTGLAIREAYLLAAQQIAKYVARNGLSQANQQALKQTLEKVNGQTAKSNKENLTLHGYERLQQRGISEKEMRQAIDEANRTGRVTIKTGKYGTPQTLYETEDGLTVVVETSGRNAGKVITAWRTQP